MCNYWEHSHDFFRGIAGESKILILSMLRLVCFPDQNIKTTLNSTVIILTVINDRIYTIDEL